MRRVHRKWEAASKWIKKWSLLELWLCLVIQASVILADERHDNNLQLLNLKGWSKLNENSPFSDEPFYSLFKADSTHFINLPKKPVDKFTVSLDYYNEGPELIAELWDGCTRDSSRINKTLDSNRWTTTKWTFYPSSKCEHSSMISIKFYHQVADQILNFREISLVFDNDWDLVCKPDRCDGAFNMNLIKYERGIPWKLKDKLNEYDLYRIDPRRDLVMDLKSNLKLSEVELCVDLQFLFWTATSLDISSGIGLTKKLFLTTSQMTTPDVDIIGENLPLSVSHVCSQEQVPFLFDPSSDYHEFSLKLTKSLDRSVGFMVVEKKRNILGYIATRDPSPLPDFLPNIVSKNAITSWTIINAEAKLVEFMYGQNGTYGYDKKLELETGRETKSFTLRSNWLKLKDQANGFFRLIAETSKEIKTIDLKIERYELDRVVSSIRRLYNHEEDDRVFDKTHEYHSQDFGLNQNQVVRFQLEYQIDTEAFDQEQDYSRFYMITLGYNDYCIDGNSSRCSNGGQCLYFGERDKFECDCKPGFEGKLCEKFNQCDVTYVHEPNLNGNKICQALGAKCIPGIPDMRCQWENDKYFSEQFTVFDNGSYIIGREQNQHVKEPKAWAVEAVILFVSFIVLLVTINWGMIQRLQKANAKLLAAEAGLGQPGASSESGNMIVPEIHIESGEVEIESGENKSGEIETESGENKSGEIETESGENKPDEIKSIEINDDHDHGEIETSRM